MSSPPALGASSLWQATVAALRDDFSTKFAVAAPFTLLVAMALAVLGPPPPTSYLTLSVRDFLVFGLVPTGLAAIAQLALCRLVARPRELPRAALTAALRVWFAWAGAFLLSTLAVGAATLAFIVPGIWLSARLFPLPAVAALEGGGSVAMLERSWRLTDGHGAALMWFLVLAVLFVAGTLLLASVAATAVLAVTQLLGAPALGGFLAALIGASLGTAVNMGQAVAATIVWQRLQGQA
ncbi:hypothetical protein IP88_01580 [alpha proteobacterium AAP81b]|nr:hypothetical protein IP88_01580 [alpha proteobacterium AAP81b]